MPNEPDVSTLLAALVVMANEVARPGGANPTTDGWRQLTTWLQGTGVSYNAALATLTSANEGN